MFGETSRQIELGGMQKHTRPSLPLSFASHSCAARSRGAMSGAAPGAGWRRAKRAAPAGDAAPGASPGSVRPASRRARSPSPPDTTPLDSADRATLDKTRDALLSASDRCKRLRVERDEARSEAESLRDKLEQTSGMWMNAVRAERGAKGDAELRSADADAATHRAREAERRADLAERRATDAERRLSDATLRLETERKRADVAEAKTAEPTSAEASARDALAVAEAALRESRAERDALESALADARDATNASRRHASSLETKLATANDAAETSRAALLDAKRRADVTLRERDDAVASLARASAAAAANAASLASARADASARRADADAERSKAAELAAELQRAEANARRLKDLLAAANESAARAEARRNAAARDARATRADLEEHLDRLRESVERARTRDAAREDEGGEERTMRGGGDWSHRGGAREVRPPSPSPAEDEDAWVPATEEMEDFAGEPPVDDDERVARGGRNANASVKTPETNRPRANEREREPPARRSTRRGGRRG